MAAISACTIFGSVCGNVVATSATLGKIALPEMRKYKYSDELSAGTIASGGNLGALVPPSTAFIVYGFVTETPIGALFVAGILPAVLLTVVFMFQIYTQCKLKPSLCELAPAATWKERMISLKGLWGVTLVFAIAMGGIMAGYFTPVEAGAAGSTAMCLVGLINKKLTRKGSFRALLEAGKIAALIMLLIFGAMLFGSFLTASEITQSFSTISSPHLNPYVSCRAVFLLGYGNLHGFLGIAHCFSADLLSHRHEAGVRSFALRSAMCDNRYDRKREPAGWSDGFCAQRSRSGYTGGDNL
jgi:tripartite ATP-independent transporter DctM subunit